MKRKGNAKVIPANPDAIFLPYQSRWITDPSRLKLMQKSRQIGLSWSTAYAAGERTAAESARVDQWVSSRDDLQARLFLEDCKMWAGIMNQAAKDLGEIVIDVKNKISAYVLEFANGRRIHSMSSNPDAQAGKRGGRILDEFALHPDPRKLWSIAYPGITWGGAMEIISTHRGSQNFFNQLVREIVEGGNPKNISLHTVTLQDALNQGFLFKLQQMLPADDEIQGMDEAQYFDFIRAGCADEESFQQEYMCNPADDDVAFLEYDLIASAEYPQTANWQQPEGGRLFAGVDIGRKKDLTVLWILELLGDVLYTRHVERLQNMRKSAQEAILWPWFQRCERICIDATGLGIGWADDAQDQFGEHRVEAVTFTPRVKEALAYPIRGAMEDHKVRIPYDPKIRAALREVTKQTTAAGNIRFTAERTADGHADEFWALGLAIHAASGLVDMPIDYQSAGTRTQLNDYVSTPGGIIVPHGFGAVRGNNDFGGY
ncbi:MULTISPECIES: phage terminase large subunit family protein [Pseudomonas]|uniref:Large terminase subunit n=3 Tax=root TaxID=1 RepID=Q5ZQY5_9CAUD|nr:MULTISPECIES: terminase family protein [Pseudomonas]YP_164067.1 terminase family protein [Pseudomonas phage B3]HCL2779239.1 terminase family protein [Pseudomonas aeruginosa AC9A]AAQ13949.1 large terminase subunit [Pseudomonas phage B3]AHC76859.1 Mu-like prophage FluMu protein gp28 [Pseudomonas aeruginosa SCV20265]AOX35596.1 phage B3 [Pseudomonas aeruginosa]AOX42353.1 phage B3 [Pseudomonas aeruginosa]